MERLRRQRQRVEDWLEERASGRERRILCRPHRHGASAVRGCTGARGLGGGRLAAVRFLHLRGRNAAANPCGDAAGATLTLPGGERLGRKSGQEHRCQSQEPNCAEVPHAPIMPDTLCLCIEVRNNLGSGPWIAMAPKPGPFPTSRSGLHPSTQERPVPAGETLFRLRPLARKAQQLESIPDHQQCAFFVEEDGQAHPRQAKECRRDQQRDDPREMNRFCWIGSWVNTPAATTL